MTPAMKGKERGKVEKEAQDCFMVAAKLAFPS